MNLCFISWSYGLGSSWGYENQQIDFLKSSSQERMLKSGVHEMKPGCARELFILIAILCKHLGDYVSVTCWKDTAVQI